jgi:antitoxin CcdA
MFLMAEIDKIRETKRATNISLQAHLVADAKRLGINVSKACNAGLEAEVRKAREKQWLEENIEALEWSNEYVRKNGLPLAKHRMF